MEGPIVFISRNRVLPGRRTAFEKVFSDAARRIADAKPRTALFAAYLGLDGGQLRIVHAFADGQAMALHFEGASERARSVSSLIAPAVFEVYGPAPSDAIATLHRQAQSSGAALDVFPDPIAGFIRAPA